MTLNGHEKAGQKANGHATATAATASDALRRFGHARARLFFPLVQHVARFAIAEFLFSLFVSVPSSALNMNEAVAAAAAAAAVERKRIKKEKRREKEKKNLRIYLYIYI